MQHWICVSQVLLRGMGEGVVVWARRVFRNGSGGLAWGTSWEMSNRLGTLTMVTYAKLLAETIFAFTDYARHGSEHFGSHDSSTRFFRVRAMAPKFDPQSARRRDAQALISGTLLFYSRSGVKTLFFLLQISFYPRSGVKKAKFLKSA